MFQRAEYKDANGIYRNPFFPTSELTSDIFWNHFPPEIRKMRDMDLDKRLSFATELLKSGFVIPFQVAVFDWEPVTWVELCYNQGFRWVPAMGEPDIPVMPGLVFPGLPSYDPDHPPKRSIVISRSAKDYPAFDPPVVVAPVAGLPLVGNPMGAGFYGRGLGATQSNVENGRDYRAPDGKTVIAHISTGLMGWSVYFEEKR